MAYLPIFFECDSCTFNRKTITRLIFGDVGKNEGYNFKEILDVSGYHADTPITIKAEPSILPTAAFINIHEHPL